MNKFFQKDGKICLYLDDFFSLRISEKYNFCNVELFLCFEGVSFPVFRFGYRMSEVELAKYYGDFEDEDFMETYE
jgi:hypothetical protein